MKKIVLATLAASVIAAPAAAAPYSYDRGHDRGSRYEQVRNDQVRIVKRNGNVVYKINKNKRHQKRNWRKGQRFDSRHAGNYRVITNPRAYRLNDAPRGYRWVQSDNDALLIAITSGIIGAVLGNVL
jgi:Ni/Co efflux regulator RcnB